MFSYHVQPLSLMIRFCAIVHLWTFIVSHWLYLTFFLEPNMLCRWLGNTEKYKKKPAMCFSADTETKGLMYNKARTKPHIFTWGFLLLTFKSKKNLQMQHLKRSRTFFTSSVGKVWVCPVLQLNYESSLNLVCLALINTDM